MSTDTAASNLPIKCNYSHQQEDRTARQQVYDKMCTENGTTKVNNLDIKLFNINDKKLTEFLEYYEDSILNVKQKGKSYMIMDNFMDYFGLTKEDLLGARRESQMLAAEAALADSKRTDVMMWLKGLSSVGGFPNLAKVDTTMEAFRNKLNSISQEGDGDRSKRVDKTDLQISLHNGASGVEQNYHIHKDSY